MADQDLDFDLRIRPAGAGTTRYTAYVANSPAGNAETVFDLPITEMELENFLLKIGQPRRPVRRGASRAPMWDLAKSFGSGLFDAVFADEVACVPALERGPRSSAGPPAASAAPDERRADPLRSAVGVPVRPPAQPLPGIVPGHPGDPGDGSAPIHVDQVPISPLRILVVISSPSGYPKLDTDREWTMLRSALADLVDSGSVVLERLERAHFRGRELARSTSAAATCSSGVSIGIACDARWVIRLTMCFATPTWRCTSRRAAARAASRSTSRRCTTQMMDSLELEVDLRGGGGARASSRSTTSRSSTS